MLCNDAWPGVFAVTRFLATLTSNNLTATDKAAVQQCAAAILQQLDGTGNADAAILAASTRKSQGGSPFTLGCA